MPDEQDDFISKVRRELAQREQAATPLESVHELPAAPAARRPGVPAALHVALPTGPFRINCPQCKQLDQVFKVSTLFGEGTQRMSLSGPTVGFSQTVRGVGGTTVNVGQTMLGGSAQTIQGQSLAPPARPIFRSVWAASAGAIVGVASVCSAIGLCLVMLGVSAGADSGAGVGGFGLLMLIPSVLVITLTVILAVVITNSRRSAYQRAHAAWSRLITYWGALYACRRCDIAYLPGAPVATVHTSQTRSLLLQLDQMGYGHVIS